MSSSSGQFEIQIVSMQNVNGRLQSGACCDRSRESSDQRCSDVDQCDTFFRVCLKEYQQEVHQFGFCTFGSASTPVLGGNSFSLQNVSNDGGKVLLPISFSWPVSKHITITYRFPLGCFRLTFSTLVKQHLNSVYLLLLWLMSMLATAVCQPSVCLCLCAAVVHTDHGSLRLQQRILFKWWALTSKHLPNIFCQGVSFFQ